MAFAAATCALAPAYTVRWHVGFYPTTLLEVAMLATIAVFVVEAILRRQMLEFSTTLALPIALFLAAGAISVVVSSDHRAALGLYRAYFLEPAAFFYVLTTVITSSRRASFILFGFGVALVWLAIPNIAVTLQAAKDHTLNVGGTPPTAIYTVSNAVALFEVPVVALAASVLLYSTRWIDRLISAAIVTIGVVSVLLTFSRGGYLALAAVAIMLALTHRRRLWLLAVVVVVGVLALLVPAVSARLSHELSLTDPSNSMGPRVKLWGITLRMLEHHPLFGSGLSGFANAIVPYRDGYTELQIYPHNILLNFWSETGVLGVIGFAWLTVRTAITGWRSWLRGPVEWRPYQLGVALALVAIVAHGLVDVPFFKNDLSFQFWAFLGLTWAGVRWGAPTKRARVSAVQSPTPPRVPTSS